VAVASPGQYQSEKFENQTKTETLEIKHVQKRNQMAQKEWNLPENHMKPK